MAEAQVSRISRFGPFELNHHTTHLCRKGYRVALQGQPARVLVGLVEAAGGVVTREELRVRLWPDNTYGEFEASVNTAIKKIRQALSDSRDAPRYVQTVHGQGYRFIAAVTEVTPAGAEPAAVSMDEQEKKEAAGPNSAKTVRRAFAASWRMAASVAGVVALIAGSLVLFGRMLPRSAMDSIAVLPFANADSETEFLSDGITEEITSDLARSTKARVISRASSFRYKGASVDPRQVGTQLGVQSILTGRVLRHGNQLVIQSELTDARSGAQIWAGSYQQTITGPASANMNQGIGREISTAVRSKLLGGAAPQDPAAAKHDPQVHALYLRARYHWNKRSPAEYGLAVQELQQVLKMDPQYAEAWVTLADLYGNGPRKEEAKAALHKALEIDPNLAQAHASLAMTKLYEWNWSGARAEFERAVDLNPNDATTHQWFAILFRALGDRRRERQEIQLASRLDPLSLVVGVHLAWTNYLAGQDDSAIQDLQKVLELDRDYLLAHTTLGYVYLHKLMYTEAIAELRKAAELSQNSAGSKGDLGYAYGVAGRTKEAKAILMELDARAKAGHNSAGARAWVHLGLGDKDKFFPLMEQAREQRYFWVIYSKIWSGYDPVRADARFNALLQSLNLGD